MTSLAKQQVKSSGISMLHVNRCREDVFAILPKGSIGAEIGVFKGGFARPMAKALSPPLLYLIDPWWTLPRPYRPVAEMQAVYDCTLRRMKWWIDRDIVKVLVQSSQDALRDMEDSYLDWAYLDSSHDETETLDELRLLCRKVKASGIIAGHDFGTKRHPGVFRAVSRFLNETPGFELFFLDNHSQWAIRRRNTRSS